ncbi:DUF6011 domain-containing protein [Streptomyces parvulus]|uniref:DUF6011 domain-containing protein n=1 Tax=Streptomyces parvulus TaxID=146923 RepID=UPI0037F5B373
MSEELLLFDVEKAPAARTAPPPVVRCSECNHVLRSKRSKEAGVSQACAAKVGVAVLSTLRPSERSRRRAS